MDQFRIVGPTRIAGRVSASGAKNAALPELAASLLSDEPVRLDGVPRVRDLETMRTLLAHLGQGTTPTATGLIGSASPHRSRTRSRVPSRTVTARMRGSLVG